MEVYESKKRSDSRFDCLLFDLDDTLYSSGTGMAEFCRKNINEFLMRRFGLTAEDASKLRLDLFRTYGSSLAGLRKLGHDVNADEYHSFVHGRLPYELIKPDPALRAILKSIKQKKMVIGVLDDRTHKNDMARQFKILLAGTTIINSDLVFTNSDKAHAQKVLERLNIDDCFDGIICFETLNPHLSKSKTPEEYPVILKPSSEAMKIAIDAAKADPRKSLFFDDNVRNIAAGKSLGLNTVLVGKSAKCKEADFVLENIHDLHSTIPEIWHGDIELKEFEGVGSDFQNLTCKPNKKSSISTSFMVGA